MHKDDGYDAYWTDEPDWLVAVCMLPNGAENLPDLDWIGRLFGFAQFTDTRMLALVGDPEMPTYELLFSFDSPQHRKEFLELVRIDGYADPDEDATFSIPTFDEIRSARPLALVFPKEQADLIMNIATATFIGLSTDADDADA